MITQEQINEAAKNNSIIDCDFIDGANWAIQQLQPKWIKIESEDDLPKIKGDYECCLIKSNGEKIIFPYYFHPIYKSFFDYDGNKIENITHYREYKPQRPQD